MVRAMSDITRDNFDFHWLTTAPKEAGAVKGKSRPTIDVTSLVESEKVRPAITEPLLRAIYDHHIHPDRIRGALDRLGYRRAAQQLLDRLPKNDRTRKGNFGEVVASEHLRQRHGYAMPVFKLRYADHPGLPMRGEDIVAFVLDGRTIVVVCVGEAKVRSVAKGREVEDAHKRLHEAYHPHPVALSLISSVLHDRGEHELADQVDQLMEKPKGVKRHNWIFLITQNDVAEPFAAIEAEENRVANLRCVHVRLDDLQAFVDGLFDGRIPRGA